MNKKRVFVDSDVVISSLISAKGAAYLLLNNQKEKFIISNISKKEIKEVADRLKISQDRLRDLIKSRLKIANLETDLAKIKKDFKDFASDPNDTHIVAGAVRARAKFLLTYNTKHFNKHKISEELGINVLTPGQYLQYLRSLG